MHTCLSPRAIQVTIAFTAKHIVKHTNIAQVVLRILFSDWRIIAN